MPCKRPPCKYSIRGLNFLVCKIMLKDQNIRDPKVALKCRCKYQYLCRCTQRYECNVESLGCELKPIEEQRNYKK